MPRQIADQYKLNLLSDKKATLILEKCTQTNIDPQITSKMSLSGSISTPSTG